MAKGILGRKIGMTQIFTEEGKLIPVTVVQATPNVVLQVKTNETDGYEAIQVGFENKREKLANKPEMGHVAKAETAPKRFVREFRTGVDRLACFCACRCHFAGCIHIFSLDMTCIVPAYSDSSNCTVVIRP